MTCSYVIIAGPHGLHIIYIYIYIYFFLEDDQIADAGDPGRELLLLLST